MQDAVQEMKEEQRSLSSVETTSVGQLLRDRAVRWQTLSVAVVNAGMQLSGIDAVSPTGSSPRDLALWGRAETWQLVAPSPGAPLLTPSPVPDRSGFTPTPSSRTRASPGPRSPTPPWALEPSRSWQG